jgi:hypothetical protein
MAQIQDPYAVSRMRPEVHIAFLFCKKAIDA